MGVKSEEWGKRLGVGGGERSWASAFQRVRGVGGDFLLKSGYAEDENILDFTKLFSAFV